MATIAGSITNSRERLDRASGRVTVDGSGQVEADLVFPVPFTDTPHPTFTGALPGTTDPAPLKVETSVVEWHTGLGGIVTGCRVQIDVTSTLDTPCQVYWTMDGASA